MWFTIAYAQGVQDGDSVMTALGAMEVGASLCWCSQGYGSSQQRCDLTPHQEKLTASATYLLERQHALIGNNHNAMRTRDFLHE